MLELALIAIDVAAMLVALTLEQAMGVRISERHHSHHDTFMAPVGFTRSLVMSVILMGTLGVVSWLLCRYGVFDADPVVPMAFVDAYVVSTLLLWVLVSRYKVSVFDSALVVSGILGFGSVTIERGEIDRMEWTGIRKRSGYRNLRVYAGDKSAVIWGVLDMEQILLRLDRFDALHRGEPAASN